MRIRRFRLRCRAPLTVLLVGCAVLAPAAGCGPSSAKPTAKSGEVELPTLRAEVLTAEEVSWPTRVRVSGSLFADETAIVGAKVAGRVSDVSVDLGDSVTAGVPLITLDREEFELQVAQAAAQLEQSRAAVGLTPGDLVESLEPENAPPVREIRAVWDEAKTKSERWLELRRRNAGSEADAEAAVAAEQVAAAQYASALNSVREKIALIRVRTAELALARQRLADAVVPAPFDGLVVERHVAPGSFVQIGDSIATIVRTDPVHFRGTISERYARRLAVGQAVGLQIEAVAQPRDAVVTRISPTLDPLSRALLFEAELSNPDGALRTGLFAEGDVTIDDRATTVAVPESAVTEFAGVEKVWKVVDGQAQEQAVLTGERRDGLVQLLEGVSRGDALLLDGSRGKAARIEAVPVPAAVDASLTQSGPPTDHSSGPAPDGAN